MLKPALALLAGVFVLRPSGGEGSNRGGNAVGGVRTGAQRSPVPLALAAGAVGLLVSLAWVAGSHARRATFPGLNGRLLVEVYSEKEGRAYRALDLRSQRVRAQRVRIKGGNPRWSPDGRRLAFEDGGIRIGRADGSRSRRIVASGTGPAWSPDGSQLAFADRRGGIYVVDADGRRRRKLFDQGLSPEWSPDGREIAFVALGAVLVLDVETRESWRLTPPHSGDPQDCGGYNAVSWSPDGAELAIDAWASQCSSPTHGVGFVLGIRRDGSGIRPIAPDDRMDSDVSHPVWAPDGSRLAVYHDPGTYIPGGGPPRIEIVGRSGRRLKTLRVDGLPQSWQPVCSRRGSAGPDRIAGRARGDLACGLAGSDTITGGAGRDRLFGEDGNDRFFARDGEFDVVGCGAGRDSVAADRGDLVGRDCEQVSRR